MGRAFDSVGSDWRSIARCCGLSAQLKRTLGRYIARCRSSKRIELSDPEANLVPTGDVLVHNPFSRGLSLAAWRTSRACAHRRTLPGTKRRRRNRLVRLQRRRVIDIVVRSRATYSNYRRTRCWTADTTAGGGDMTASFTSSPPSTMTKLASMGNGTPVRNSIAVPEQSALT